MDQSSSAVTAPMDDPSPASDALFGVQQGYLLDTAEAPAGTRESFGDSTSSVGQDASADAFSNALFQQLVTADSGHDNKRGQEEAELQDYQALSGEHNNKRRKKDASENWDSMYSRLVSYKNIYGDTLVPKRFAHDPKLGTWVETQRVQYKRLERAFDEETGQELVAPNNRLTLERLKKLRDIEFAWTAKNVRKKDAASMDARQLLLGEALAQKPTGSVFLNKQDNDAQWEEMYQRLSAFKEKEGHCLVPRKYDADPRLASWVEQQRSMWNRHNRASPGSQFFESAEASTPLENTFGVLGGNTPDRQASVTTAYDGDAIARTTVLDQDMDGFAIASELPLPVTDKVVRPSLNVLAEKKLSPERKAKLDALGFVWSLRSKRIDDHWDTMFQQLVDYRAAYGDCLVPSRWDLNQKLGKWVEGIRYEYTKMQRTAKIAVEGDEGDSKPRANNSRLTQDRIRQLESIGFEWRVKQKMKRYYDKQWDAMFEQLLHFKEQHGHCMVPKRYETLGSWCHTQRVQYKKLLDGRVSKVAASADNAEDPKSDLTEEELSYRMTDDRRRRLEDIGFIWSAREIERSTEHGRVGRSTYDDQWDAMFERLKAFKEEHGHCLVPKRYQADTKLGVWTDTQRVQYKKMKKKLAEQNGEGCATKATGGSVDEGTPASALNEHGDPIELLSDTPKISVGRLTDERVRRLDDLGFVWSLRDDWNKHYEELCVFRRDHGHCNVPARYAKNRRLGIWVSSLRQQYKILHAPQDPLKPRRSSPLTPERIDLLNQLGFTWTIRSRDTASGMQFPHHPYSIEGALAEEALAFSTAGAMAVVGQAAAAHLMDNTRTEIMRAMADLLPNNEAHEIGMDSAAMYSAF